MVRNMIGSLLRFLGLQRNILRKAPSWFLLSVLGIFFLLSEFRGQDAAGFVVGKTSDFIYLFAFIHSTPCPKLDIGKWERGEAVDILATFSAAGEQPCPTSVAQEASFVTGLGLLHALFLPRGLLTSLWTLLGKLLLQTLVEMACTGPLSISLPQNWLLFER